MTVRGQVIAPQGMIPTSGNRFGKIMPQDDAGE